MSNPIYDHIVLGGGIIGSSTAYYLSEINPNILLLDQYAPGHTLGSSHGDSRVVRFNYPEPIYVEMALLCYPQWEALGERIGRPLIQKTGLLDSGPEGCIQINEVTDNLQRFNIPFEILTASEINDRFPYFHYEDHYIGIYQADGAVGFATPAVRALWQLVKVNGGYTKTDTRILAIDTTGSTIKLRDDNGYTWETHNLVITAGAWTKKLLAPLDLDIPLVASQEQLSYFPSKDGFDHRVGQMPDMIDFGYNNPFYTIPQVEIPGVKVGWHHTGTAIDPNNPIDLGDRITVGMQAFVERRFPHLSSTPVETINCLYTNTPDYHFVLDRHPNISNIVIGAGFSGHGFKFAPTIGTILANLSRGQESPVPLDTFALGRFAHPESLVRRTGA